MGTELSLSSQPQALPVRSVDDLRVIAQIYEKAAVIRQDQGNLTAADFAVKIMAGLEMGVPPHAAITGIHVIKGKAALGANLLAALVRRSPAYDYEVLERSATICRLAFFVKAVKRDGTWQRYEVSFSLEEARKGQVQNLDKWPAAMLFARAITIAVRTYAPDLMSGIAAYVPEELGARVDEDGEPVAGDYIPEPQPAPTAKPAKRQPPKADEGVIDTHGPFAAMVNRIRELQRALEACGQPTPTAETTYDQDDKESVLAAGASVSARVKAYIEKAGHKLPADKGEWLDALRHAHATITLLHGSDPEGMPSSELMG